MKTRRLLTVMTSITLLFSLVIFPVAAVTVSDINFEIDGNTASDGALDWESVILGGAPDWKTGPASLIQDGNSGPKSAKAEQNIFATGGKFGDPAGWNIQPGNVPAQNDLTDVYVEAFTGTDTVSGDSWIAVGMHRIKKQGTFDLDFEFNQVAWDGKSGTLVRTPGDIVVGFELSGNPTGPNDLKVLIVYYKPSDTDCSTETFFTGVVYGAGFCEVFHGDAADLTDFGVATMNQFAFDQPPWGAFDTDGSVLSATEQVEPYFFAEAAIDLSELGIDFGCPGFGSVHAKSRSSLGVTADLKDLAGPIAFSVSCKIDGYKFHDLNANGTWDTATEPALKGWTINLLKDGVVGVYKSTTTDATGKYEFTGLSNGTYTVQEVCPTASTWYQSYPSPNPATTCGNNTHTFVVDISDPIHSGNFGNYQKGTASGMKYKDADADGTKDTLESGLNSWTINAYNDVNGDGLLDSLDTLAGTVSTAGGGLYSFSLPPGKYIICEVGKTDWKQTDPTGTVCASAPGSADGGYAITLTSGLGLTGKNFGNTPLSNFDVRFYDLTGFTNATISCKDAANKSVGTPGGDTSPETTLTANGVLIGTYTCTITITDP